MTIVNQVFFPFNFLSFLFFFYYLKRTMIWLGLEACDVPKNVTSSYIDSKLHLHFRLPVSFTACNLSMLLIDSGRVELESKHVQSPLSSSSQYGSVLFDTRLVTQRRYHVRARVDFKDAAIANISKIRTMKENVILEEFIYVGASLISFGKCFRFIFVGRSIF